MSAIDTLALNQAYTALKNYGAALTLSRSAPGTYNPATGSNTPTVTTFATYGVKDGASLKTLGFRFGDGLVQSGDIQVNIPGKGLPFDPAPGDQVIFPEWPYVIVDAKPVYSGSLVPLWQCLVRK